MARPAATAFALVVALAGCAGRGPGQAGAPLAQGTAYPTDDQRILACLDLRDHIVDLYASEYVVHQGLSMSSTERAAFRDGWAEELAKRGTFEHFEQSCFYGLTPRRYECGMQSQSPGSLVECMTISSR